MRAADEGAAPAERECTLEGVVDRLVHVSLDGYTVAVLAVSEHDMAKVAGTSLLGVQPGETVRVTGHWAENARHGSTFRVDTCERVLPATVHAIRRYLGSGLVRGIGTTLADAIVGHFGEDTLQVIDRTPRRLLDVHLIGPARLATITAAWAEQRAIREVMVFLQGVGVSPTLAVRIHKQLGEQALRVVRKEPYRLVEEVHGIGFATADAIALQVGVPEQSIERMKAAVLHTLEQARLDGNCFLPRDELLTEVGRLVGQDGELVRAGLEGLRRKRKVLVELLPLNEDRQYAVFLKRLHQAEVALADGVLRLLRTPSQLPGRTRFLQPDGVQHAGDADQPLLHPSQQEAVQMALTQTVSILTGGPGCGKSLTVRRIARLARSAGAAVTLAAPTGRAAKRLTELTGMPAMTVHRLVNPRLDTEDDGGLFDLADPRQADLIVVDEASMLDLWLAEALVASVPEGAHLLLVGDVDQLPSVGPGRVLWELLRVPEIPAVRLTHVFRQGEGSKITENANKVRCGEMPRSKDEFWFIEVEDPEHIANETVDIATRRIPQAFHVDPRDVQVLCPGKSKQAGALNISRRIQDKLNPSAASRPEHWADQRAFRLGDKVMHIRNDYNKGRNGVFNGSAGVITDVMPEARSVEVTLDEGETINYDFDELDDLIHGYAITVHRAQGSEYPYVVVPLATSAGGLLLRRNLLYTAITRAKKLIVLVGQRDALRAAVNRKGGRRHTALGYRFAEACQRPLPPGSPDDADDDQLTAF